MVPSLKRTLASVILVSAVSVGFLSGQRLHRVDPIRLHSGGQQRSYMLSAAANAIMSSGIGLNQDSDANPSDIFEMVLDHVQRDYVEGVGSGINLSNGAMARMFASLNDPKTNFLEPTLRQARQDALGGKFHGIGAAMTITSSKKADVDYRYLSVVDTMPGSPAEKAGLKPGDHITEIDGHWIIAYSILVDADRIVKSKADDAAKREEAKQVTEKFKKGYSLSKAINLLSTGTGKTLALTVEHAGKPAPVKVDLTTSVTEVTPVEYRVVGKNVGYLRIRQFNAKATEAFQAALSKTAPNMKGLIVDLRSNPGGMRADSLSRANGYDSALKLIAKLTNGGTVATIERKPTKREPLVVTAVKPTVHVPLIVLVDEGTANISELVAAALRDTAKAKIIGAHTFGDAILQSFSLFKDGSGAEISSARLLTSAGADLTQGITPDIVVAAGGAGDMALERALATLGS